MREKYLFSVSLLLILTITQLNSAPLVSRQVLDRIFLENQIYLIYISENPDIILQSILNQYCNTGKLCAILDKSVDNFQDMYDYIGNSDKEYFTIIDAARKTKYIHNIIDGMTVNDLLIFQSKFQQGLLIPFYASEKAQYNENLACKKVTGEDLQLFIYNQAQIKVLLLYSNSVHCKDCQQILKKYIQFSQKYFPSQNIRFGHYNVLKNDNSLLKDQLNPYFYIYTSENVKKPFGLEANLLELQRKIQQILQKKQIQHPKASQRKKQQQQMFQQL